MNPSEINFTFNGWHSYRDMGCWASWSKKPMGGRATRNTHKISGRSGTVLLDNRPVYDEMAYDCTLALREAPTSEADAQAQFRRVCAWLRAGRCELELDSEPGRYWLAEVDDEIGWSNDTWDEGMLTVRFTLQPYSYSRERSTSLATFAAAGALPLYVPSGDDVPVNVTAENIGTATMTGLTVALGDAVASLSGIACLPGDTVAIRMDDPIGATLLHPNGDAVTETNLLGYATRFDPLLGRGAMTLTVTPVFSGAGGSASVLAAARGVAV